MEKIKGFAIELDMDHLSVDRGLRGLKGNLRTVNSEMRKNMSAFDRSDRSVEKYQTSLAGLNKKLEVQKVAVSEAKKEYEKMVEQHGLGSKEAEKAAREYNNQAASLNNLERYIGRTTEELAKFEREQRIASSGWTKLSEKLEKGSQKLKTASEKMGEVGSTLTNKITKPALGAAGALAGLALFGGFKRLIGIDTARAQLEALGHDAKSVDQIMEAALNSVRGTSYGLDAAATTAASAVAAGVDPAKDLEKYLSLATDAAAVANVDFNEMGDIFNKVQTTGKAQNDVLKQLSQRGIPIYQYLAETIGVGTDKITEMARDGKISTKDFLKAVEKNIGGAAKVIGEKSFAAAVKNIGSDIGRIGANFLDAGGKGGGFFSKLKPMLVDFRGYLEKAEDQATELGVKFGEAFENMIEKTKDLKKWYDNLTPAQQDLTKKVLLFAPAVAVGIGPALQLFSKLGLGISGALSVASKLTRAIGVARGAGLAAGLASLGPLAVGGIAVAGIAAVSVGIYALHKKSEKAKEVNLEFAESLSEQATGLEKSAEAFDELSEKAKISNKELAELNGLNKRIAESSNPGEIKELQKQYDELAKNSGLSKDELKRLFDANADLIKQSPDVQTSISTTGDEFVETTDKVYKQVEALRKLSEASLKGERAKLLEQEKQAREEIVKSTEELEKTETRLAFLYDNQDMSKSEISERVKEINEQIKQGNLTEEESWRLDQERTDLLSVKNGKIIDTVDGLQKEQKELQKGIDKEQEKIDKLDSVNRRMADIYLKNIGINEEGDKGLQKLDESLVKNREELKELKKQLETSGKLNTKEQERYDKLVDTVSEQENVKNKIFEELGLYSDLNTLSEEQIRKVKEQGTQIDNNNSKTDSGIKKERERSKEAGKDVDKNVNVKDNNTIRELNKKAVEEKNKYVNVKGLGIKDLNAAASKPVSKTVSFVAKGIAGLKPWENWEKGTPPSGHPGGPAVIGEAGSELVKLPSGRSFLSPGTDTLLDLPRGTHVIPHNETKRIVRNAPRYADGTRNWASALGNSEFARLLMANNSVSESSVVVNGANNNDGFTELLKETIKQNEYLQKMVDLLMSLLDKDLEAVLAFEPVYNAVKQRMNEDNYSQRKQRRR